MLCPSQTVAAVTGLELICILTLRGSPPNLTTLLNWPYHTVTGVKVRALSPFRRWDIFLAISRNKAEKHHRTIVPSRVMEEEPLVDLLE